MSVFCSVPAFPDTRSHTSVYPQQRQKTSAKQQKLLPSLCRRLKQQIFVFQLQFLLGAKNIRAMSISKEKKNRNYCIFLPFFMHPRQSYAKCLFLSHSSLLKLFKLATHRLRLHLSSWLARLSSFLAATREMDTMCCTTIRGCCHYRNKKS
jgi:hypothetical protein